MNTGMLARKQIQVSKENGLVIASKLFRNLNGAIIVKYVGMSIDVEKSTALALLEVGVKGPVEILVRKNLHSFITLPMAKSASLRLTTPIMPVQLFFPFP